MVKDCGWHEVGGCENSSYWWVCWHEGSQSVHCLLKHIGHEPAWMDPKEVVCPNRLFDPCRRLTPAVDWPQAIFIFMGTAGVSKGGKTLKSRKDTTARQWHHENDILIHQYWYINNVSLSVFIYVLDKFICWWLTTSLSRQTIWNVK